MLSAEKHCELLTNLCRDQSDKMYQGFRLFIQMFTAIAGGAVVAHLQYVDKIPSNFEPLSDALAALVVVTCVIMIFDAYRSWFGYRVALSNVAGPKYDGSPRISPPRHRLSSRTVITMLIVMFAAWALFVAFNPLKASNEYPGAKAGGEMMASAAWMKCGLDPF
jgi:hypothetical protein